MLDDLDGLTIESAPSSSMLDLSAFEETPTAKKGRKRAATKPPKVHSAITRHTPDTETLFSRHLDNYALARHESYGMQTFSADCKAAKAMLKTYGLATCLKMNDAFFASQDPFIKDSDYSFGVFKGVMPRLVILAPVGAAANLIDLGELS